MSEHLMAYWEHLLRTDAMTDRRASGDGSDTRGTCSRVYSSRLPVCSGGMVAWNDASEHGKVTLQMWSGRAGGLLRSQVINLSNR
jgi:hypothetical protein